MTHRLDLGMMKAMQPTRDAWTTTHLVDRCLQGDEAAWQELVTRYARLVHSIPVRYGLTPAEVDDVGQDVFLALAQNLSQIVEPERLPSWLVTTTRRLCWRLLQDRRREQPPEQDDLAGLDLLSSTPQPFSHTPTIDDLFAGWSRQESLAQGMQRLGQRCRELLTLLFLDQDEPSYERICVQLNIPKGGIGPTRNRCLRQLRAILEGLGFAD